MYSMLLYMNKISYYSHLLTEIIYAADEYLLQTCEDPANILKNICQITKGAHFPMYSALLNKIIVSQKRLTSIIFYLKIYNISTNKYNNLSTII